MKRKKQAYGAAYIHDNIPPSIQIGEWYSFGVVVKNTGTKTWVSESPEGHPVNMVFSLNDRVLENGFLSKHSVKPQAKDLVFFSFQAPLTPGTYRLKIDMVEQNVTFFEHQGCPPLVRQSKVRERITPIGKAWLALYSHGFMFRYSYLPLTFYSLLWHMYAYLFRRFRQFPSRRRRILLKWKALNKNLAHRQQRIRQTDLISLPHLVMIDTTTRCNLKCVACFRQSPVFHNVVQADISEELLDRIIEQLFPTAESVMLSCSGEPLLSHYTGKVLKALDEFDVGLHLTTNGTLLDDPVMLSSILPRLSYLEISFDSVSPDLFEELRPGAEYARVLSNARKIGEYRLSFAHPHFDFGFSMTLFCSNIHELPEMVRLVAGVGGNLLRANFGVIFREDLAYLAAVNHAELYNRMYREAHECAKKLGILLSLPPPFEEEGQGPLSERKNCDFIYHGIRVTHDGKMTACISSNTPCTVDYDVNDVRKCWNGNAMRRLRMVHDTDRADPVCKDCYVFSRGKNSLADREKQILHYLRQ